MTEAATPSTGQGAVNTPEVPEAPTDFREYARWRETGELPEQKEPETPAAAEETPQAKTEPDSEPEGTQEQGEPEDDDAAHKRGSSRQRKIDRLTRELAEARELLAQRNREREVRNSG